MVSFFLRYFRLILRADYRNDSRPNYGAISALESKFSPQNYQRKMLVFGSKDTSEKPAHFPSKMRI